MWMPMPMHSSLKQGDKLKMELHISFGELHIVEYEIIENNVAGLVLRQLTSNGCPHPVIKVSYRILCQAGVRVWVENELQNLN